MPTNKVTINGQVKRSILVLNHHLPASKRKLWVTAIEMQQRLIHCGVHRSLSLEMVESSLKTANRGEKILRKRTFDDINYFIPTIVPDNQDIPSAQRFNKRGGREQRVHINPDRNYFCDCNEASTHLVTVNSALEEMEEANNTDTDTSEETNNTATTEATSDDDDSETEESNVAIDFETEQSESDDMEIDTAKPTFVPDEPMFYEELPYNGNIITDCDHMDNFIREATCHSARCGRQLQLIKRDNTMGAAVKEVWLCPACGDKLVFRNCNWVKTEVVEPERKHSRLQPEINLKLAQLFTSGVNESKILKAISATLGIKMSKRQNLAHQTKKVKVAIKQVAKVRIEENRREHNALTRAAEDYEGDIEFELDGEKRSVCVSNGSTDGSGCTRSFNHRHKGKQSAFITNSQVTKKPLCLIHSQISCCRCTRALNQRIKAYEEENNTTVTLEEISNFSKEHDGICYRNSKHNPASAEEYQATAAARDLLLNEDGTYRGDDTAVFLGRISADNDTKSPNNFIREQANIIGDAADGKAEHDPDYGHVQKGVNNGMFNIREQNPSFKGARCLSNVRIKSMHSDFRKPIKEYKEEGIGNIDARSKCLRQIESVVYHHAGDHSKCFQAQYCTFIEVKNEHPAWTEEEIQTEAANRSKRHGGKSMSMGKKALVTLSEFIAKTFNEKSIDRIARCGNSNASEAFWGSVVEFSEGKRKNLDQADSWATMLRLAVCNAGEGNRVKTHMETSTLLGAQVTAVERVQMKKAERKSAKDRVRLNGEDAKNQRTRSALLRASTMGKESAKKTRHKSGKVPLSQSAKVSKHDNKPPAIRKCGICRQPGHTATTCSMPRPTKRKADLMDWDNDIEVEDVLVSKKIKNTFIEW